MLSLYAEDAIRDMTTVDTIELADEIVANEDGDNPASESDLILRSYMIPADMDILIRDVVKELRAAGFPATNSAIVRMALKKGLPIARETLLEAWEE